MSNEYEDGKILDPILLEPIPNNLIVSARTIAIGDKSMCFNAKSLWNCWISLAKIDNSTSKYARNPLNK